MEGLRHFELVRDRHCGGGGIHYPNDYKWRHRPSLGDVAHGKRDWNDNRKRGLGKRSDCASQEMMLRTTPRFGGGPRWYIPSREEGR